MNKDVNRSFQNNKINPNDRTLDKITQKLVSNEDLLAEFICKIVLIPAEKEVNMNIKDETGVNISIEDQILNVENKTGDPDKTNISYQTSGFTNKDTSIDLINQSMIRKNMNNSRDVVIRKESEDSFFKM